MKTTLLLVLVTLLSHGCAKDNSVTGATGPQGQKGIGGTNCTTSTITASSAAPNGGSLIQCTDGTESLVLNGTNGSNGTPGTVITPIQFCPGTPFYPSTFPEVGFCINNDIYAVYSANGGFLTIIEPGVWQSNAVGSSCTFTIKPNCQVIN